MEPIDRNSPTCGQTKTALGVDKLEAVADRGYFSSEEILACEVAGITVTLPKPMTSTQRRKDASASRTFSIVAPRNLRCPAGEKLAYHYTNEENGLVLRRYWTNVCQSCAIKPTAPLARNDGSPDGNMSNSRSRSAPARQASAEDAPAPRDGRTSLRHPQDQDGSNPFPDEALPRVATEMALHVLAYNLTRVMNIMGIRPLIAAMRA